MVATHSFQTPVQLELFRDGPGAGAGAQALMTEDELTERLADCEREDRTLLRMVVAATIATGLLGLASALVA